MLYNIVANHLGAIIALRVMQCGHKYQSRGAHSLASKCAMLWPHPEIESKQLQFEPHARKSSRRATRSINSNGYIVATTIDHQPKKGEAWICMG
jgi:hypothetical protein